jgi:anti-sigma regulatory factor (Ser/Thr protein kinase)
MTAASSTPTAATAPGLLRTDLELGAYPSAVPCARGHVRSVAIEWGLRDLADTAELLASELVTNAINASQHLKTPGTPVVRLWLVSDQISLVIHVWDGSKEMPVRKEADADDLSGRGLMIIDALSAEWGSYQRAEGKVVWAMVTQAALQMKGYPDEPVPANPGRGA